MASTEEIALPTGGRPHETRVRVRYAETDQMGIVYYAHYAVYCEIARTEWIRSMGLSYAQLEKEFKIMLPVRHFSIIYHHPARYDDEIVIKTWLAEPPSVKLRLKHQLYRENTLLAEAEVILIFVDKASWRPCRPPKIFYAALAQASCQ
ncbi:MAG: thioesterase family protein [Bacteroidia bacterium]|nr:acyl-CoA thioesterase [Bacteroidia bacterium]MDW8133676.1 thioesterase family protein [Bacteroidia bacterium]